MIGRSEQIGAMDQRVALEAPGDMPDGAGGQVCSWHPVAVIWARVIRVSNGERGFAGRTVNPARYVVTIHARADVCTAMRLDWQGCKLAILAIDEVAGRPELMKLTATEAAAT